VEEIQERQGRADRTEEGAEEEGEGDEVGEQRP